MKINLLSFLLLLASICSFFSCQKEVKSTQNAIPVNYIDSLYKEAKQLKSNSEIEKALHINLRAIKLVENQKDSTHAKLLRQRVVLLGKQQLADSAIYYASQLLEIQKKEQNLKAIADAIYLKAFYFNKQHIIDSSLSNAYQSLQLYKQINDSVNIVSKSSFLVGILNNLANYEEAEQVAVEALGYLNLTHHNKQKFSNLYNDLAIITKNRGNYKEALYWYSKALDLTENMLYRNTIENNKAVVYLKEKKYDKAFKLLSKIKEDSILNISKYITNKARVLDNWVYAKSKLGHPDAEKYLLNALSLRKQKNIASRLNASYIHLAEHYADRNDPRAVEMAKNAYKTSKTYNNPDDQLKALAILIETTKSPRKYALLYRDLSDSINTLREYSKSSYAKIKYDVAYNRHENENLKAQALIRDLEVNKARFQIAFLMLLVVVLIGAGYWRYKYFKNKYKEEKERAAYHAELHISKKIHDEVANDVFNTLTLIQKQSFDTSVKTILEDSIDNLYRKARDIARNYSNIDVGSGFNESLVDLLSNYNSNLTHIISKGIKEIPWKDLSEIKKIALYRSLQELLVNMKKHSKASFVVINFHRIDKYLDITYTDNGIGIKKENLEKGHGIKNVENRIKVIKGTINFDLSSRLGCRIVIRIPL